MHEQSLQEMLRKATTTRQKGKATQHNSPETVIFQRKLAASGGTPINPRPLTFQATLLPTKLLRQLSWLGQILHTSRVDCALCEKTLKKVILYFEYIHSTTVTVLHRDST